jgi:hypothetical protein
VDIVAATAAVSINSHWMGVPAADPSKLIPHSWIQIGLPAEVASCNWVRIAPAPVGCFTAAAVVGIALLATM